MRIVLMAHVESEDESVQGRFTVKVPYLDAASFRKDIESRGTNLGQLVEGRIDHAVERLRSAMTEAVSQAVTSDRMAPR